MTVTAMQKNKILEKLFMRVKLQTKMSINKYFRTYMELAIYESLPIQEYFLMLLAGSWLVIFVNELVQFLVPSP